MKKLFCVLLTATFFLSTSLYSQDKDAPKDKDNAPAADKDKDKAPPADKDKAAPADKDKAAKGPVGVVEEQYVEFFGHQFSYIDIGGKKISPITLWGTVVAVVVIAGVWFLLGRKRPEEGSPPPA